MVIGIHTFLGGGFNSFYEYLNTGIRQVLNCAVPIFIACSGFFLAKKQLDTRAEIRAFYYKQITRVYIPCLLWSIPWFALHIQGGGNVALGVLYFFLCGFSVYYFVVLMIQYYLLLPAIKVIKAKSGGALLALSIGCSLISVALVVHVTAIEGIEVPLTLYAGPFPLWIVFFVLGVFLANCNREYKIGYLIAGVFVSLVLQVIESKLLLSQSTYGMGFGIKPTSFLFSMLVILVLFSTRIEDLFNANSLLNRAIVFVGKVSFVVYLSHTLLIIIISKFSFYCNVSWLFRFLGVAFSDIALVIVLYHLTPQKLKRIIGF